MAFDNLKKALSSSGRTLKRGLQTQLRKEGKLSSGGTSNSLKVRSNFGFNKFQVTVKGSEVIQFIDQGRRAGSKLPPEGSLLAWMGQNNITPEDGAKGIESLEFLIRRAIAKNGIKPTNIISRNLEKNQAKITARIEAAIALDVSTDLVQEIRISNAISI